jgi:hypothetical protein
MWQSKSLFVTALLWYNRGAKEVMPMNGDRFDDLCRAENIFAMAEEYISSCRDSSGAAKPRDRLPNLAGFCRHFGIRSTELARLKSERPELYDTLCLTFEDEALNFSLSPTIMAAYFKKRLGYGEKDPEPSSGYDGGEMRLIFEHDIDKDGL